MDGSTGHFRRTHGHSPHVLRNAMLPIVTMLGMDISVALGGAIFTESVYSLPGLGRTLLQSLDAVDMPIMVGIVVFATLAIITRCRMPPENWCG